MMGRVRSWLRKNWLDRYVIARNEKIDWVIYPNQEAKRKVIVISPTKLLAAVGLFGKTFFSQQADEASTFRKLPGLLLLRFLKWREQKEIDFRLLDYVEPNHTTRDE